MMNSRGAVLGVTMCFMVFFVLMGMGALSLSGAQGLGTVQRVASTRAFWLAEAGVEQTRVFLKAANIDGSISGYKGTVADPKTTPSALNAVPLIPLTSFSTGSSLNRYFINPAPGLNDEHKWLVSATGIDAYQIQQRTVHVVYNIPEYINPANFGKSLESSTTAYPYNSEHNTKLPLDYGGPKPSLASSDAFASYFGGLTMSYVESLGKELCPGTASCSSDDWGPLSGIYYVKNPNVNISANSLETAGNSSALLIIEGDMYSNGVKNFKGVIWVTGDMIGKGGAGTVFGSTIVQGSVKDDGSSANLRDTFVYNSNFIIDVINNVTQPVVVSWQEI